MWLVFKRFFSSPNTVFILIILAIMAMVVIPQSSAILEKFGFKTRASLMKDNATLTASVEKAVEVNKSNIAIGIVKDEAKDIVVKIADDLEKEKAVVLKTSTKLKQTHEAKVTKAKTSTSNPDITYHKQLPSPDVIEAVSEANISSLWDAYNTLNT